MKYKIEVSGRGGDSFIFRLTEEQREKFSDADVESGSMEYDEICGILGVEDYFSSNDQIMGLYNGKNHGEHLYIEVFDESGEVIWKSPEDYDFPEVEVSYEYNDGNYLLIEDYQKGLFWNYQLDLEEEFNSDLLSIKIVELLDGMSELITDIKYNGESIDYKDYGDTSSKGFTYYLL
jgi:hypothetical protein